MENAAAEASAQSAWQPFRHRSFAVIWGATVVSNIGSWMYSAAAAWLMTSLDADPLMVSLVQVVTNLPMFLFALPAGALADIVDKRLLLLVSEIAVLLLSVAVTVLVSLGVLTPVALLVFTFLVGAGNALTAPAWQSVVPSLVPRSELHTAVAANSVGVNISRAIGPALGGVLTVTFGVAAPFWINAFSNLGSIVALVWWRPPQRPASRLPAERFFDAMRTGLRYVRNNPPFRATVIRAVAFFLFASAYWALLPLVARRQLAGGADSYGLLLGAIGASAVVGAMFLPRLKQKLGADRVAAVGSLGTALALLLYGSAHGLALALCASAVAGACWIATLSSLNVSAQVALPEWVRGRGLALYVTAFFGTVTFGSLLWGQVASMVGLPAAHFLAAAGAVLAVPLTWRSKLQIAAQLDLTPSMHWPTPVQAEDLRARAGPVLVTIEYLVGDKERHAFLDALRLLAAERRRDGAYAWQAFEDVADPHRIVETFLVASWLEHLRQHERVTQTDRRLEDRMISLAQKPPRITHLIAVQADQASQDESGESRAGNAP